MNHPKITKEMKAMAISILEGDFEAAVALRDVIEECKGYTPIPTVKKVKDINNIRVVVFLNEPISAVETEEANDTISQWLENPSTNPLFLGPAFRKMNLYEIDGLSPEEEEEIDSSVIDTRDEYTRPSACYRG